MTGGRTRLGDVLVQKGVLTQEQLAQALAEQQVSGRMLGEVLVEQGVISSAVLVRNLAAQMGVRGCVLRHGLVDPTLLKEIGREESRRLRVLPLFRVHGVMSVAMAEPQSLPTVDRLSGLTGCEIRPVLALKANILEFIEKYAGENTNVDSFLASLSESDVEVVERESIDEGPTADIETMVSGSPIVNLVNLALLTAVKDGASDIHIEPDREGTRVRYRIDGTLRHLMKPPLGMHASIVSRVKVLGKMDIAEKRLPQEGRLRILAEGREIDLRLSSMPTLLGEKLVIRVLDKANLHVRMQELGMRPEALVAFKWMLRKSNGLVLVTGPTGSGKTTTLYSALDLLTSPELNIVTVEDPVEYQLELVNQIHVQESIGMTFARALRSILRQDPDVIMVGEIRDEDTARVAVQAALTGHLVLATLHTNDAPSTVARLFDMGVESYLLSSALNGIVAQRLARTNCPSCETKYYPDEHVLAEAGLSDMHGRVFRRGTGCQQCHDTGFHGRTGVYELMVIGPELRQMIHESAPSHHIRRAFREQGGMPLREEGVLLAIDGRTSLEEVLRVTQTAEDHTDRQDGAAGGGSPTGREAA